MVEAHASEAERIRKPVDKVMQAIEEDSGLSLLCTKEIRGIRV